MRPGAAASCRAARPSPVRRPPAAPAAAPAERPCALPPKADPGQSCDGLGGAPGQAAGGTAPLIVVGLDDSQASGRRLRDPCAVETERPPAPVFVVPPASQQARYAAGDAGRRAPSESAAQWKRDLPSAPNRMIWAVSAAPTVNDRPAPIRRSARSTRGRDLPCTHCPDGQGPGLVAVGEIRGGAHDGPAGASSVFTDSRRQITEQCPAMPGPVGGAPPALGCGLSFGLTGAPLSCRWL